MGIPSSLLLFPALSPSLPLSLSLVLPPSLPLSPSLSSAVLGGCIYDREDTAGLGRSLSSDSCPSVQQMAHSFTGGSDSPTP